MNGSIRVAIIGATGLAGQQFIVALQNHPYFRITALLGSSRSQGKSFLQAITDENGAVKWYGSSPIPDEIAQMHIEDAETFSPSNVDVVCSAVDSDSAKRLEPRFASAVPVFSTASAFRYEPDVPILIPGVNLEEHLPLLDVQQKQRNWKGFIAPGPNCTVTGLAITLKPLLRRYGLRSVIMTSFQSCSGAGRTSGVLAIDMLDNIIPYIPNEEEKVLRETQKILGTRPSPAGTFIQPLDLPVSCTCTRVPVIEGHMEAVYVGTNKPVSLAEAKQCLESFGADLLPLGLPSAPRSFMKVHTDPYRPQPRLDRDEGDGMTTVVGRLREEHALGGFGLKYVLLSHNTKMGAAKGSVLTAEYLVHQGKVGK